MTSAAPSCLNLGRASYKLHSFGAPGSSFLRCRGDDGSHWGRGGHSLLTTVKVLLCFKVVQQPRTTRALSSITRHGTYVVGGLSNCRAVRYITNRINTGIHDLLFDPGCTLDTQGCRRLDPVFDESPLSFSFGPPENDLLFRSRVSSFGSRSNKHRNH